MKNFPKKITILGRKYSIKMTNTETMVKIANFPCEACVDFNTKIIYIHKDLSQEEKLIGLFHETQHIAHMVSGASQVLSPEMQEILCESVSWAFYDLMIGLKAK
jgi:hypothetical protein